MEFSRQLDLMAGSYYGDGHDQVREDMQAAYLLGHLQASTRAGGSKRRRRGDAMRFRRSETSGRTVIAWAPIGTVPRPESWQSIPWAQSFIAPYETGAAFATAMNQHLLQKHKRVNVWHCVALGSKGLRVVRLPLFAAWHPSSATDDVPTATEAANCTTHAAKRTVKRVNSALLATDEHQPLTRWAVVLKSL